MRVAIASTAAFDCTAISMTHAEAIAADICQCGFCLCPVAHVTTIVIEIETIKNTTENHQPTVPHLPFLQHAISTPMTSTIEVSAHWDLDALDPTLNFTFDDRRFRFLDFPPEIRNKVYEFCLYGSDRDDQVDHHSMSGKRWFRPPIVREMKLQGKWMPYVWWFHPEDGAVHSPPRPGHAKSATWFPKDDKVLLLNSQIRREALSLYLRNHLSLDIRGPGLEVNSKFHGLRKWMRELSREQIESIRVLETRETVMILHPKIIDRVLEHSVQYGLANFRNFREAMTRQFGSDDWRWVVEIAAIESRILDDGHVLEVWSRLEIFPQQIQALEGYVKDLAEAKTQMGALFDGKDLLDIPRWVKAHPRISLASMAIVYGCDTERVSWWMKGTNEEVEFRGGRVTSTEEWKPELRIQPGYRHLVANGIIHRLKKEYRSRPGSVGAKAGSGDDDNDDSGDPTPGGDDVRDLMTRFNHVTVSGDLIMRRPGSG